ncbi:MAG: murein L,D-transpeptidase catalytic domain family protein [Panacagrimonas sp.]
MSLALAIAFPAARAHSPLDPAASLPAAGRYAIERALEAVDCAIRAGQPPAQRLAVIDYRLPSNRPRLWVLDLATGTLLFEEWVAHGRGSGETRAVRFSNVADSKTSSLGLYRTRESYDGDNGYSLRLDGLEPGFNDQAWSRSIVMHGADYVSSGFIRTTGRLGRSHGCPAVRREVATPLIDAIKDGQYLFAYYPDPAWLAGSSYLGCTGAGVVKADARPDPRSAPVQEAGPPRGVTE